VLGQHLKHLIDKIRVEPSQTPILISDQNSQNDHKEKIIEIVFESFGSPAFFTVKRGILSLLESGRKTGFVFSSGAEATELVPVCDGYVLQRGMSSFAQGGESVTRAVLKFLDERAVNPIYPYFDYEYSFNMDARKEATLSPLEGVSASVRKHFKLKIAREAKEEFVRVHTDTEEK